MTSTLSPQIRMANDIAVQFHHLPADEAVEAITKHIRMFWDPRMKAELQRLATEDSGSFDPLALAAAKQLSG
ncbi:formate dehydrogenase subunit delta [Prauserella muralis]|uniref:Formate dehydrogenase n=1 Tax=Prauserella muralis TaxID=588067 RepID=A0A2V4B7V2_9PSEU|nr:formate dehydrogenase subunit delta [Prauserella muralis]PXY31317.1 formate dehydrogenase [Prauserella muralis]TWE14365.1 formate dehydrogenase subunit delta [Prauserella muralis]